ncbi:hypothetical protein G7009_20610 [Pseudomonas capeferrum]|uniref:hypothetical protein n=1 Tax=Pseudomonas capeferrum TaxID=1495066 RepID=UPI0015E41210|nr:hypothetical protein [Pseudomonas capeferrum]MBA1204126.1 hypothetical protein [Pseudomonas capeferrum]
MRTASLICLLGSMTLVSGCFDRSDHPAKDADQSKPSLQMQKPDTTIGEGQPAQQPITSQEKDN